MDCDISPMEGGRSLTASYDAELTHSWTEFLIEHDGMTCVPSFLFFLLAELCGYTRIGPDPIEILRSRLVTTTFY